ncbi:MAG: UDP-3-O-acyl-N-acetylglucosamine deacetylase [Hydrogenobacter sp.]
MNQGTIKEKVLFEGIGIHSGEYSRIVLHPEEENTGIRFLRWGVYIPAKPEFVVNTDHSTDLGKEGVFVKTVEHLMAVLYMLGVDNITVEFLEGFEVPILDGSGYYFYKALKDKVVSLSVPAPILEISSSFEVRNSVGYIKALPYEGFSVAYMGSIKGFFEERLVEFRGNIRDVVFARTFCYDYELEHLLKKGLAKGGSLKNALLLGMGFVYNEGGMRSEDEPLRHKLLDLIGDLALVGKRIKGRIVSYKGGHTLNYLFVKVLSSISETSLASSSVSTP